MAIDTYAAILFTLSAVNLIVTCVLLVSAHKPVAKHAVMLAKIGSQFETNGFAECAHCNHIVARYFIDGAGKTTCANCKPEGMADAIKNGYINSR